MTEESYLRDLEAVGQAVPSIPDDYGLLRSLLASLPSGTPPDVRSGRTGVTATAAGAGGLDASNMTIQSATPIGSESGASQGVSQAPTLGIRNYFRDSRLLSGDATAISLNDGLSHQVNHDFTAIAALGATGASSSVFKLLDMITRNQNPFSTSSMDLKFNGWTAAGTALIASDATIQVTAYDPTVLPWMVFSFVVYKSANAFQTFTNVTSATIKAVIRDNINAADLAVSTPLDFKNLPVGRYVRIWVALPSVQDVRYARVHLDVVTSGSGAGASFNVSIGNPQWELAPTQVPTIFVPEPTHAQVVSISPDTSGPTTAVAVRQFADGGIDSVAITKSRLTIGLVPATGSPALSGRIGWGVGTSPQDVRLARAAAGHLQLDSDGTANATRLAIRSTAGQSNFLTLDVAGDTSPRAQLRGDATETSLSFGSGAATADIRARRSAAKTLLVDDNAGGNLTLVNFLTASLQRAGTEVSLLGHGPADHADVTRNIWLAAHEASLDGATLIAVGASPNLSAAINYADAATSGAYWSFMVPVDWASGALSIIACWTPAATDAVAHTVRWTITAKNINSGSDVIAAGTATTFTGASGARTVNIAVNETTTSTGVTPTAGGRVLLELQRIGADAADTYVGAVRLTGILVQYTANQ